MTDIVISEGECPKNLSFEQYALKRQTSTRVFFQNHNHLP